jgi:hypothetical protein
LQLDLLSFPINSAGNVVAFNQSFGFLFHSCDMFGGLQV